MNLVIVGLNYKTADIELREKIAFTPEQIPEALHSAKNRLNLAEIIILSTCNRTEIYAIGRHDQSADVIKQGLINWICQYHSLDEADISNHTYAFYGNEAISHVIQVACGLDSMIIGEPQVFGQTKQAYAMAQQAGTANENFIRLFQYIFNWTKRIRTETDIGVHPVSFASTIIKLAQHIFADLSQINVLLIGAGEFIEPIAKHFYDKQVKHLTIANRTLSRATDLAKLYHAQGVLLSDIPKHLPKSDIVIACTASQLPILGKGTVESALKQRKHKPIFMVDLAVPRDIEPEVNQLADIYLYSIDDLQDIITENQKLRDQAIPQAMQLIDQAIHAFPLQTPMTDITDVVKQYRQKIHQMSQQELEKAISQLQQNTPADDVLSQFAYNLTQKLLHEPSIYLKNLPNDSTHSQEIQLKYFKAIFNLTDEENDP